MSKYLFADKIISKIKDAIGTDGQNFVDNVATRAAQAVADGITEYLIDNTIVTIQYQGVIPGTPPTADPINIDTFKIQGKCASIGPANSFESWIEQIETNIIAGFMLESKGQLGVLFSMQPFLNTGLIVSQSSLKAVCESNPKDPQKATWEIICDGILTWLNGNAMNQTVGAGTHATSTGPANITKITVS